jgi:hypothetical protein
MARLNPSLSYQSFGDYLFEYKKGFITKEEAELFLD